MHNTLEETRDLAITRQDQWQWGKKDTGNEQNEEKTVSIIRITPSRWKVSTLICTIIPQHWHGKTGVFRESWRTFKLFLLFSFKHTTVSASRKTTIVSDSQGL